MLDLVRSLVVEFRDVLILLIGAGIGFFLTRIDRFLNSRKRRRVLATAALGDLRWLDHILRQMAEQGVTVYDSLEHPALTVLLANVDLLKLSAVSCGIATFENMITTNRTPEDSTPPNPSTDLIPYGITNSLWAGMYGLPTASGT